MKCCLKQKLATKYRPISKEGFIRRMAYEYRVIMRWYPNTPDAARKLGHCLVNISLNSKIVIVKKCTPLGSKCTPHRSFVKLYRGIKRNRLYSDNFRITVAPVIVKRYRISLANRDFYKKELDTSFDTHCIKTGVQLWSE